MGSGTFIDTVAVSIADERRAARVPCDGGPARAGADVNEWVYCPRLAWLEWVEGQWAESGDTAQGRRVHARVNAGGSPLPDAEALADGAELKTRSVMLSSERLGLIAKIDLLEAAGGSVTPVDYKKGRRPHVAEGAFEPERVQVCAQALVLEDNGYKVSEGMLRSGWKPLSTYAIFGSFRGDRRGLIEAAHEHVVRKLDIARHSAAIAAASLKRCQSC